MATMDALLRIKADVQGQSNISSLAAGLKGLNQAAQLSNADLGRLNIQINRQARETGNTVAGLKAHAGALAQLRDRVEIGGKAWNRLGIEIDSVKTRLQGLATVQERFPRITGNTLGAVQQQISRLQQLRQEVEIGTKKFELYTAGINRLRSRMATAGGTGASGPGVSWRGMAGAAAGSMAMGGGFQAAMGGAAGAAAAAGPAGVAIAGGVMAGGALIAGSTRNALDEAASIRRISTLSDDADNLMAKIRDLSIEQGHLANNTEAGAAAYEILSSGFSKTSDVLAILKASTYAATGGFSDIKTVADAATSIMNSFGLGADKVTRVVDQMVQTQNDGKIVVDQYAQSVGRLAPTFAVAGLSVEEMNAAISALTAKGAPVETTMSGLNQTIKSIIKPTQEAKDAAKALGLEFSASALQAKGLGPFLQDVTTKTKGNTAALAVLFSDIDGFKAVASLTNDGLKAYNKSLENMDNKTRQAADAARKAVDPVKQFDNAWKDFSSTMGQMVLPSLSWAITKMTTLMDLMSKTDWSVLGSVLSAAAGGGVGLGDSLSPGPTARPQATVKLQPYTVAGITYDPATGRPIAGLGPARPRMTTGRKPDNAEITALIGGGVPAAGAGGGGGTGGRASTASGSRAQSPAAQIAMALKSALGITDAQAAGITGNLMRESGLNPRVNEGGAVGLPRGVGGYGLAQWTGTRQSDLVGFAGSRGAAGDMATQLRFMVSELMGPESQALSKLKTAQSPEQAAVLFDKFYERSGVKALGERQGNARKVFTEIAGSGPAAGLSDFAQAEKESARAKADAKEQAAQQLTAARDLLATKEAAFEIANAVTPLEKLSLEFDNERTRRMQEYVNKLGAAKSDEERLLLVQSQAYDIRRAEIDAQEKMKAITSDQLKLEQEKAKALEEQAKIMTELTTRNSVGAGLQQGLQGYVDQVGTLRDAVGQLTTDAIGGLEDSLTSLATTGAGNFKAFAASVLKDVTRMIIRQLVLKSIMQIIGGIGGGGGAQTASSAEMNAIGTGQGIFAAARGAAFANGIVPFANGGIVSSPTLFKFANGGGFRAGLMGEAGPEAIMPLRRGKDGRLGVAGGGGGSTTINVSVDAKGSSVQGDGSQGAALARAIAGAVQTELIKQKRPGGILTS